MTTPTRRDVLVHEIEEAEETVLYDAKGRRLLVLNPVGAGVWALCDGEHTVTQIVEAILDALPAERARVQADVEAFLRELEDNELIELR